MSPDQIVVAAVALVAMVAGEVWRMSTPALVRDAPLSKATALALAMATGWSWPVRGPEDSLTGLLGPVLVAVTAVLVASGVRRDFSHIVPDLVRLLAVMLVAGVLVRLPLPGGDTVLHRALHDPGRPVLVAALMLAAAVLAVATPLVTRSVLRSVRARAHLRIQLGEDVGRHGPLALATATTATVMALSLELLGPLSLVLFLVPLLLLQPAVERQRRIRLAQRQTIVALARLTEEAGLTSLGHSDRVAALAVPLAREVGVHETDLPDVEAAALLHDIGQVGLTRPIPGGATVEVSARDQRRIAGTGAAILARTADLSRLAAVVADVGVPHHRAEERGDVSLAARVVRVASAYDDLTGRAVRLAGADGPAQAVDRLVRNTPHDYDPRVVEALIQLLERRGDLPASSRGGLRV
ncbi:HD-GYP domain-containing protein [Ornithinimicrobium flavum]|uniref:HD-GYP domain-containing protein n=1 Tax=Ornithinimicrobium flavum TaxID=1288636 RepID=UPI00106F34CC|nr:HD domain-containing phosphohydrolase [Ornithinimicrobium flavum]